LDGAKDGYYQGRYAINTNPIGKDGISLGPFSLTDAKDVYYHGRYVSYNKTDGKNYCWTDSDYFNDDEVA